MAALRASIECTAAAGPGVRVDIRRLLLALPLRPLPGRAPLVDALKRHASAVFGTPIEEAASLLYTDARL